MAVVDTYVDPNLSDNQKQDPNKAGGSRALINCFQVATIAAGDDNGSVYRLGRINSNAMLYEIAIECTAITGGTDWDLGFYDVNSGAVVDANVLMDGTDLSSASSTINGLSAVAVADRNKRVYELLGLTSDPCKAYDLALTANTVGTAAGSIAVRVLTAQY